MSAKLQTRDGEIDGEYGKDIGRCRKDCLGSSVALQADIPEPVTGEKTYVKPAKRTRGPLGKLCLGIEGTRSAPSSPTANISVLDLTWDEEEARSVKRMREDAASTETGYEDAYSINAKLAFTVRETLKKIDTETRSPAEHARERNTKKEIKEISSHLRSLLSVITSSQVQQLLQRLGKTVGEGETKDKGVEASTQTDKKILAEMGSQTGVDDFVTGEDLKNINSYEDFTKLRNKRWRDKIYERAFITEGSPLYANKNADLVMIVEDFDRPSKEKNLGITKKLEERYPDLSLADGKLRQVEVKTKVVGSDGSVMERNQFVNRLELEGTEIDWFDSLKRLRNWAVKMKRLKLVLYPPTFDYSGQKTRDMLECLFRDTEIKCLIYVNAGISKRSTNTAPSKGKSYSASDAVIIKSKGVPYAEMLKSVKEKFREDKNITDGIQGVRKSRDGDINGIKRKLMQSEGGKFRINTRQGRYVTLYLKDLDGITTKQEVADALKKILGDTTDPPMIGELRPFRGGNQAVTLRASEGIAKTLQQLGKIKVGLCMCKITSRVEVPRCYRCCSYGHKAFECKAETDCRDLCRNCGKTGHREMECKEGSFCLSCKSGGHKVGAGICPEFKKALSRARLLQKKKKAY